jgi:hypothetical protein
MMFSSNAFRFILVLAAACNAVTSAGQGLRHGLRRVQEGPGVDLGTAGDFAILAKTGISTVPASVITGDIGVSPITTAAMTGFSFTFDSSGTFSTSDQVTGKAYAADYISPTPSKMITAVSDMETAYTTTAGRANTNGYDLKAGLIGGETLTAGVYTFASDVFISSDIYLDGSDTDIFIIQMTGNLLQAEGTNVILQGDVKAENIFWQVAGHATFFAGAHMEGILLVKTAVAFVSESSLNGRVLAQTACSLQVATITQPNSGRR